MKTILVVDDEYALAETLVELFEEEGYRVVWAANGKDGLERLGTETPSLVLVDNMMPIMDGKEFVRRMRAIPEHQSTPILMMSAAATSVALADGTAGRVSGFLKKPFTLEVLLAALRPLIGAGSSEIH